MSPPRRVVAHDYRAAYAHRAQHYRDPVMMTGRDRALTSFKIENVVARLALDPEAHVLDVGPGDGTLFRLIGDRVAQCVGVDPSDRAVEKLRALFADAANVRFEVGTCTDLPVPDRLYDIVVINSVIHMLPGEAEVRDTLDALARVSRVGATVFVGEVPFRHEREHGLIEELRTQVRHVGGRRAVAAVLEMYVRPVLRGEPLLIEPVGRTLAFTREDFEGLAREAGFEVECFRHLEPRGPSTTRNDYRLTRSR